MFVFEGHHTRLARRARQRRRVYQSGKGTAANRRRPGCRRAHRWQVWSARDRPRPAPRQRPGPAYGLVLLGDPPSFDEDDSDPHCCVKPLDAVALPSLAATAACRARHRPATSCSAPMTSRLRCLVTVYGPGCLPGHRDCLKRHDTLGFDAGLLLRPVVPREPSERLARPPSAVSGCPPRPQSGAWRIRFDPPPPPVDRAAWRIRAHAGASPDATPPYSRIASLRIGTSASASTSYGAAPAPDFHRRSGLPVCRDGSRPRRHRAAPTWALQ